MKASPLVPAVVLLVAFLTSAMVGYWQKSRSQIELSPPEAGLSDRVPESNSSPGARGIQTEVEKQRAAIRRARSLSLDEIKALVSARDFSVSSDHASFVLFQIILERLSHEDPVYFLELASRDHYYDGGNHFIRLMEESPDLISDFLLSKRSMRFRARLFGKLAWKDPDQALQNLPSMLATTSGENQQMRLNFDQLARTRFEELEKLMEETGAKPGSDLVKAVFRQKLKANFDQAFDTLITRSDGFDLVFNDDTYNKTADPKALLARLEDFPESWRERIAKNPNTLFRALSVKQDRLNINWEELGFTEEQTHRIRAGFLRDESYSNPSAAFTLLNDYEFTADEKREIFRRALTKNQSTDRRSEIRNHLSNSEDQTLFDEMSAAVPAVTWNDIKTPDDLFEAVERNEMPRFLTQMKQWDEGEKEAFYQGFEEAGLLQKTRLAIMATHGLQQAPSRFVGAALTHLLHHPEQFDLDRHYADSHHGSTSVVASTHALNLFENDVGEALNWLDGLPAGKVREEATNNVALHWSKFDPAATNSWLESLPHGEKERVSQFVKINGLR